MKPSLWLLIATMVGCGSKVGTDSATGSFDGTDAWWNVGGDGTSGGSTGWGPGDDDDDDDDDDEAFREVWGELALPGGDEGAWGFYDFDPANGGVICEFEGEITNAAASSCPGCEFAWDVTFGEVDILEESGAGCAGVPELAWSGTQVSLGHASPETLYADFGSGWEAVGYSESEADEWFFAIEDEEEEE